MGKNEGIDGVNSGEINEKFEREKSNLRKELRDLENTDRSELKESLDIEKKQKLKQLQQKHAAELAQQKQNKDVSQDLINEIMEDHAKEEQELNDMLEKRQGRMRMQLAERLAKRRAHKMHQLELNQQSEKSGKVISEVEKKLEEKSELLKSGEKDQLQKHGKSKEMVKLIMKKRQDEEVDSLEKVID